MTIAGYYLSATRTEACAGARPRDFRRRHPLRVRQQPDPAFVAAEVAAELDVTHQGARHQMEKLVDAGYLARKKPGRSTVLYWLTPEGHAYYAENTEQS
jgi:predicted ArsR family transcriptional regulator